jgi:hypothetical protein
MVHKYTRLESALNDMIGAVCWSVLIRGGMENGLTLSLGDKLPRSQALAAPALTPEQRAFAGAFEWSLGDCTWRLDSPDQIVTSWSDTPDAQGDALAYLMGAAVTSWDITWPGLDLTLHFDNALALRAFCDQTDPDESGTNYDLLTPSLAFNVGVRSNLTVHDRIL